jgi:FlaA1/EpsC-like NDP-sugar epimerase
MSSSASKIKSALVIGGCGSLGHHTVEQLLKLEPTPRVSVFDIQTKHNRVTGVDYYNVDITDKNQISSALSKACPDVIFHTASPPAGLSDLPLYMRVNVGGTRNLVECARVSCDISYLLMQLLARRNESITYFFDLSDNADRKYMIGTRCESIRVHIQCLRCA